MTALAPATLAFPVLETERLHLRVPGPADTEALVAFMMSPRSTFYGGPLALGDAWRRVSTYTGQWLLRGYGMFAVTLKDSGETIGMAGPFHPADIAEPEMCWLLGDDAHEGQGLAREACVATLAHLFTDLGWRDVVSYIHPDNGPSLALAQRLGARPDPASPSPLPGCDSFRHYAPGAAA